MKAKIMKSLQVSGLYGLIKSVEELYWRVTRKFSVKALEVAVESYPYEVSETFKAQMLEIMCKNSQAVLHVQRIWMKLG